MSVNRVNVSSVRFEINARQASASMQALEEEARDLNRKVTEAQRGIENLGNVPKDNPQRKAFEADIAKWKKDIRDINQTIKDYTRGVKAADELLRNYETGTIESMSMKAIKAGQNGLKKRIENIDPNKADAKELESYRTITEVIRESQRVVDDFKTDAEKTIQTIRDGGDVSVKTLRQTRDGLRDLKEGVAEGTKEWQTYQKQLTTVQEKLEAIGTEETRTSGQKLLGRAFRGDFATADVKTLNDVIAKLKEYQSVIDDPEGKGARIFAAAETQIKALSEQLGKIKGDVVSVEQAMQVVGQSGASVEKMSQAMKVLEDANRKTTDPVKAEEYTAAIDRLNQKIKETTGEWMSLKQAEEIASKAGGDGFIATAQQMTQATQAIERQRDALIKTIQQKQRDGKATADEEKELQRLEKVLKDLKFEQDNFNMSHKQMDALLKQPKSAEDLNQLKAAIKRADGELMRMKQSLGENNKQYKEFAAQVKNAKNELKMMEGQAKATSSAFEKAWSRLKTYVGLYVGAAVAMQKLTATMGDLMELSDKMGEVRKTTGFTADEVGRLTTELRKMDTRTSLNGLMELASVAGTLGLKTQEDVEGFTEAANKLMVALPEMGKEGAKEMLKVALATGEIDKIRQQMEQGLIDGSSATAVAMEKIGSTIDRLRASSASAAPAITDFVKRVGAVGAQSGISIDQVAALGSTVDALGMRVEMSATALSRMIPAIKNNAFAVAKAIGVTPETLRGLFDAGRGMEAILMIFQHIKDQGMDEDSVEKMLGMGGMQEIMKELNQMGARAGIVFAGLSQNVDELRRQLGVAAEAYEDNIAIQQEYDKMNETTAAKWERLKNQLEEAFVGDTAQRLLGGLIDALRGLVDFLTGNVGPALNIVAGLVRTFLVYWALLKIGLGEGIFVKAIGGLKAMGLGLINLISNTQAYIKYSILLKRAHTAQAKAAIEARMAQEGLNKAMIANVWVALAAAVAWVIKEFIDFKRRANETVNALAQAEANLASTVRETSNLFHKFTQLNKKQAELTNSTKQLKEQEKKLKEELEALRKKYGEGAEQTDEYKKKQEELEKATKEVTTAEGEAAKATSRRSAVISEINEKYSTYLGYMLSEASTAETVASAHDLIIAALKEEMYWREQNNAFKTVREQHQEKLGDYIKASTSEMEDDNVDAMRQQNIMSAWQAQLAQVTYDASKGGFTLTPGGKAYATIDQALEGMKERFNTVLVTEGGYYMVHTDDKKDRLNDWWGGGLDDGFKDWTKESLKILQEASMLQGMAGSSATKAHEAVVREAQSNTNALIQQASQEGASNRQIAEAIVGIQKNLSKYGEIVGDYQQFAADTSLQGIANVLLKDLPADTRKAVESEMQRVAANGITPPKPTPTANPWGSNQPAESTNWKDMTAEQLVARRKQMKDFVNAIQTDTDVKAVLEEDAALKKAIEKGMSSDMRTVIEWYNTERLKIQDELHARHLTNTGDWMDPKKQKSAHKQFKNEIDAYLHELDAYYTERKTRIEEAGTDEGLTEAEIKNRTLANEMEWRQRRAELQKLYARRSAEVTEEEQQAIYHIIAERTGDSEKFVEGMIQKTNQFVKQIEQSGEKGAAIVHDWLSKLGLELERDYLRQQQALTKQMKAIEAIIDKERPFNGITKSLRENLATMDILTGDMRKEYDELMKKGADMKDFNERQAAEELRRTTFMLGEAENAYSTTIESVMARMREKGMTAWADWLQVRPEQQEATMAQLRQTYDQIQDAIKKEASQLKKQAEIMWNNILLPGGDGKTTLKQALDQTVAQLGIDQGRVSRANSLIGAGAASERVADRLAIKQMQLQLRMQEHYYNLMKKQGQAHVDMLNQQADAAERRGDAEEATRKRLDAQHAAMSLNLATSKEETELAKQREEIIARTEESQNRLYTSLKEWGDLLAQSLQSLFEASNAGNAEYYNELAKLDLTGKGGPGAGTYIVIDNEGTSDAKAHYEYLDERQALERQHEIERENAMAEAWRKVMDDLNAKMNEQITDWMNAALQNASIDANTDATLQNTEALAGLTNAIAASSGANAVGTTAAGAAATATPVAAGEGALSPAEVQEWTDALGTEPWLVWEQAGVSAMQHVQQTTADTSKRMQTSTQSAFAKMTQAANLYGIAYSAMSNDNLSTTQKFQMMAVQAAGNAAISMLTTEMATASAKAATDTPGVLGTLWKQLGWAAAPVFAIFTGLLGGLMGLATSKISKSKAQIAQATGVSGANAGKLTTGILTYAEGNVNEFTDPASLTPGRQYNVDGADGKTYRARYMGKGAKTHITNGPEFHLVGEAGREAIIDAKTTRQIQMDEPGIWQAIKTLYRGGRLSPVRRRGMAAFADGNIDELEEMGGDGIAAYGTGGAGGMSPEQMAAFQSSLDRNNELLERALTEGIKGVFDVHGAHGLVNTYDTAKKEALRHGERYT